MNQIQRQCKVRVLDECIEFLHHSICDGGSDEIEMQAQRFVVRDELSHQAKRLSRKMGKLPGMKEENE